MPRYLPVQLDAANQDIKSVYREMEQDMGFVPNFIKTLAHSGNFLKAVADLYRSLMGETSLSERIRQLAILKTCQLNKCKYMVLLHTELARKEGWTDEQVELMEGDWASSDEFNYCEKEVLRLAELVSSEPDEIQEDYWTQLDNHFTSDQIVELIILISFFNMINRFILSLRIEPDALAVPEKA